MGRKKKLKKALISKNNVIEEHEEKLRKAVIDKNEYLMRYYQTELRAKKEDRERTLKQLLRKKGRSLSQKLIKKLKIV